MNTSTSINPNLGSASYKLSCGNVYKFVGQACWILTEHMITLTCISLRRIDCWRAEEKLKVKFWVAS